mgnify:CR=1 FL=1
MYIRNEDTICAPATIPGTGAISVIRVSGPEALSIADKLVRCRKGNISGSKGYTLKFGIICNSINNYRTNNCVKNQDPCAGRDEEVVDEVLVSIFRAPHSYTGEDSVEISCHASSYIVSTILNLLYEAGARAAEPGEFTQRAYLNGKVDLVQAEAVADVIASQNAAAHRVAFKQMKGGFSSELRVMRSELLELVSLMELELDFSEEEVEFADRSRLDTLLEEITAHISRLIDSFRLGNAIKNGVPVAIAGATNTGKSTLLNALLGEDRAIVSDVHGTTRDTIEETLNIDGILFRFIDTAGLRETTEIVEKIGIERTFKKISEASVILGMVDLTRDFETSSETVREIVEKVDFSTQKLIILLNKTDICPVNKNVTLYNYIVSQLENKGIANTYAEFLKKGSISDHQDSESGNIGGISSKSGVKDLLETVESEGFKSSRNSQAYIIPISAKTGSGINCLRTVLTSTQRDLLGDSDTTLVTNQRHVQALTDARTSLLRVRDGLASGLPTDLAAQDIREAIYHLGSIVGEISTDEVLGNIFANFCIGK